MMARRANSGTELYVEATAKARVYAARPRQLWGLWDKDKPVPEWAETSATGAHATVRMILFWTGNALEARPHGRWQMAAVLSRTKSRWSQGERVWGRW